MTPRKARLEEECGQHLIGHEWAYDRPGSVREDGPIGAELVCHHDSAHHAHGEGDREDLQPVFEEVEEHLAAGLEPQGLQHGEIARQPDREGGKDEVKADRERELDSRQQQCGIAVRHGSCLAPRWQD
jgi:hypothetical protein